MANILNEIPENVLGILRASRVIMIMVLSYWLRFQAKHADDTHAQLSRHDKCWSVLIDGFPPNVT